MLVQRIDEVDIARSDELVPDEDCVRHGPLLEHAERERDNGVAVALGEVRDCADESCVRAAELIAGLADGVLADDGVAIAGSGFFKGVEGGERADVVDSADQGAAGGGAAEVLADHLEDLLEVAAAVEVRDGDVRGGWELGADAVEESGCTKFEQRSSYGELEQDDLVDLAGPVVAGPAAEGLTAFVEKREPDFPSLRPR